MTVNIYNPKMFIKSCDKFRISKKDLNYIFIFLQIIYLIKDFLKPKMIFKNNFHFPYLLKS